MQDLAQLAAKGVPDAQQKLAAAQRSSKLEAEPNHYAVLGMQSTATPADIKQAFRCILSPSPDSLLVSFPRPMLPLRLHPPLVIWCHRLL